MAAGFGPPRCSPSLSGSRTSDNGSRSGGTRYLGVAGSRLALDPGKEVRRNPERPGELGMDMLELFPRAVRLRPKPFVLLLDRVGLYPQPIVLVQHSVDGGCVMLDHLDPSERVAQRCERFGQWRVRWERHDRV